MDHLSPSQSNIPPFFVYMLIESLRSSHLLDIVSCDEPFRWSHTPDYTQGLVATGVYMVLPHISRDSNKCLLRGRSQVLAISGSHNERIGCSNNDRVIIKLIKASSQDDLWS
jgi:hypothetical protein